MSGELVHYGVKGMKWGVRKDKDRSLSSGYSRGQYNYDAGKYGKRGAERINQSMKKGDSLQKARDTEHARWKKNATRKNVAKLGAGIALMFGPAIMDVGVRGLGSAEGALNRRANRKRDEAGARMARDMMADDRGLTNYSSIRLNFDPVSGEWK